MQNLRCMSSKICVKFQRVPLKFHTKSWTHTPQNMHFTVFNVCVWVTISLNCDVISLSETAPVRLISSARSCDTLVITDIPLWESPRPENWAIFPMIISRTVVGLIDIWFEMVKCIRRRLTAECVQYKCTTLPLRQLWERWLAGQANSDGRQ